MDYLIAAAGLVLLLIGGELLVRGAVNMALRLGIPALVVSLTIVAFGTSAPELIVVVQSVLRGAPGLALGNVVGSNTANILLVLGLPALLFGLASGAHDTRLSYVIMVLSTLLFIGLAFVRPITWIDGLILLTAFAAVQLQQLLAARKHRMASRNEPKEEVEGADPNMPKWKIGSYLVAGLAALPFGADLLVDSSVRIATRLGVSETVIGLTLVAVGTSLPELATTTIAAYRQRADVALGNVIGSNVFNLLGIIGLASLFGTIPVDPDFLRFDLWVMLGASLMLAPFVFWPVNMGRVTGAVLTAAYGIYVFLILS
ncbi:calcium/sodium antiporter [Pseudoruegeria sp. HB172150]|uniref:calcium/sodium antiporter n=1 Tax=Pseudoruegeria sp. HB172150 TaxID=2721164 RepID=UPI001556F67F|nr:calcium/sodium antiporter [Pseudoruegeria sp. HB172150]